MDIKSSKEIAAEFVGRYNFSHIFTDNGLPSGREAARLCLNNSAAVEFLLSSALTGNKVIGFFNRLPAVSVRRSLRGECLFISRRLPEKIDVPTLFCRKADEMPDMLVLALKTASDSKLPVSLVISDDVFCNYTDGAKAACDLARTSPYLHPNTFKNVLDGDAFKNCVSAAWSVFAAACGPCIAEGHKFSFTDNNLPFFPYLLPGIAPENAASLKGAAIKAPSCEASDMEAMLNNSYALDVSVEGTPGEKWPETVDFLCPGCPFINIFSRMKNKNVVVFTDIDCEGMLKTLPVNVTSLESYMGMTSENLNVKTLFIGSASGYKPCYDSLLKNGRAVFLNDCGLSGIKMCFSARHPRKADGSKNILFPYGCGNIKRYSKVKINIKKCRCIKDGQTPACLESVRCPAIYVKGGYAAIDSDMCTGCLACKIACPFGAVS